MKTYRGYSESADAKGEFKAVSVEEDGQVRPLELLDQNAGVSWGYVGGGPYYLAHSILADYFGRTDLTIRLNEAFKLEVIAKLPMGRNWTMTGTDIEHWLRKVGRRVPEAKWFSQDPHAC